MKVLVTGSAGQLGYELERTQPVGIQFIGRDIEDFDLTVRAEVEGLVEEEGPDLVINAAAYTAVDRAEEEAEAALAVNRDGAGYLAKACADRDVRLIHISTDFVFDGCSGTPYSPEAEPTPINAYGRTKLEGEQAVRKANPQALILRTSWLYSSRGQNFVKTIIRLSREKERLTVISDQVGSPTWAKGLAEAVWDFSRLGEVRGTFHWTDAGVASWYDFAVAIQEEAFNLGLLKKQVPVVPVGSEHFATAARRPAFSVLDKSSTWKLLGRTALHWRSALRLMLPELGAFSG